MQTFLRLAMSNDPNCMTEHSTLLFSPTKITMKLLPLLMVIKNHFIRQKPKKFVIIYKVMFQLMHNKEMSSKLRFNLNIGRTKNEKSY